MPSWAWLLIGAAGGYVLAKSGGGIGYGLSLSVGAAARGAPPGSGTRPLDQPDGSPPYQEIGSYNPLFSSGFPDYIDNRGNANIVDGGAIT